MDLYTILHGIALFRGCSDLQLEQLLSTARNRVHARGETLFLEGENALGFYVVTSGRVKVYKLSPEGREQILRLMSKGESIGEVPVFAGGTYPAYAEAMEKTETLFFPREAFIDLIGKVPGLSRNMIAVLARRLLHFTRMVEDLSLKEVPGRLAAYLLLRSEEAETVELDISKVQLANLMGTTPETVSRMFARMSGNGLIRVSGKTITLLNRKSIEALARGEKLM